MEALDLSDELKNEKGEIISWVPPEGASVHMLRQYEIDYNNFQNRHYANLEYIALMESQMKEQMTIDLSQFVIKTKDSYVYYDTKKISAKLANQIIEKGAWRVMGIQYKSLILNSVLKLIHSLNVDPNKPFKIPTYLEFIESFLENDLAYLNEMEKKYPLSMLFGQTPKESHGEWQFRMGHFLLYRICQSEEYVKKAVSEVFFEKTESSKGPLN